MANVEPPSNILMSMMRSTGGVAARGVGSGRGAGATLLAALALPALAALAAGCSTASASGPAHPVTAAPPPKDDGNASKGGSGGETHSAALEQLKIGAIASKRDKQNSVLVPLPDAEHWTRVKFLTVPSLVGFRYGKDHHGIVAAFVTHVDDNTVDGACTKSFESWAMPMVEAFEVELSHEAPEAFAWSPPVPKISRSALLAGATPPAKTVAIVEVDSVFAKTATILSRESYAAAWAAYPAWDKACLVVGVAVPVRSDEPRARAVRDRFVKEVFPKVTVTSTAEPKERY